MKKLYLFALAAAMALFNACSSDDGVAEEANSGINIDGTGYIALTIHLPESSEATRANDGFDDGKADEYNVTTADLVLFKGSTGEQDAVCIGAYPIYKSPVSNPPENDNVTSVITHDGAIFLKNLSLASGEKLYALVMVNTPPYFTIEQDNTKSNYGKLMISGSEFTGNFSTLRDNLDVVSAVTGFTGTEKNNFFMTNTVLSTVNGQTDLRTSGKTMCLIDITDNVKSSASAAQSARALIRVERAVAKVTLSPSAPLATGGIKLYNESFAEVGTMNVSITGWQLLNTMKSSYLVRHWTPTDDASWLNLKSDEPSVLASNPYRSAGTQNMTDEGGTYYRTYFGSTPSKVLNSSLSTTYQTTTGAENPIYCFENMLTVDQMIGANTTMAVIQVQFATGTASDSNPYYTLNGDASKFYTMDAIKTAVENYVKLIYSGTIVVTPTTDLVSKKVTFTATHDGTALTDAETAAMNAAMSVYEYTDRTAYYYVLIKHFGDDLTPWKGYSGTNVSSVYPGSNDTERNNKWLGRYGVLRNNWYDISVSGVGKIGDFTPNPPTGDIPDDLQNSYIAAKINVLSWAKRTQSVTLQ